MTDKKVPSATIRIAFILTLAGCVILALIYRSSLNLPLSPSEAFTAHRIAHAGGGIQNKTYTNSIDALNLNIKKGFLYFEIDFSFTSDSRLVCLHDWDHSFTRSFGYPTAEKVSLQEFEDLVTTSSEFQKCTAGSLADWMRKNPMAIIVTDVKEDNIAALTIIASTLPDAASRVIPQVYNPANLEIIREMGFDKLIWTLYRFHGSNEQVLERLTSFRSPLAVTMPTSRAESTLPQKLKEKNIPSYVHTINSAQEADEYMHRFGITEIYTDFLTP